MYPTEENSVNSSPPSSSIIHGQWVTSIDYVENMKLLDPATGLGIFQKVALDVVKGKIDLIAMKSTTR